MLRPCKVHTKLYIHSYEHFIHTATAALPKGAPKYKPPYVKKKRRKNLKKQKLCRSQWSIQQQNAGFILSIRLCCSSQCCLLCTGNNNNEGHLPPVHNTLPPPPPPPRHTHTSPWLHNRWLAIIQGMECCWWCLQTCSLQPSWYHRYSQSPCLQQGNACLMILTDFHTI